MKFILKYPIFKILLILISFIPLSLWSQVDLHLSPNAVFYISPNAVVTVNGNISVANSATFTQANASKLYVSNDFTIYGTFTSDNGDTYFIGSDNSTIGGTGSISFYKLYLNKDINSIILYLDNSIEINNDFGILSGYFTLLNNTPLTIDLDGNLIINNNCLFDASTTGSQNHTLNFAGNFTNNGGTIDFNTSGGKINTNFIGITDVNLGLSGNYDFNEININKTNETNIVNFDRLFTAVDNFLTLTKGEFSITGTYSISHNFFKLSGSDYIIPKGTTFELDNPNATVLGQSVESDAYLRGKLHIKQGTFNVGTTGQSSLIYDNTSSEGLAELSISGGTANIYTSLHSPDNTRLIRYEQTGGNLNVGTGSSNSAGLPTFDISNANSIFRFDGGTLTLKSGNTNSSVDDYRVLTSLDSVNSTSSLIIDAISGSQIFEINTSVSVGNFTQTANNNSQIVLNNGLLVNGNFELNGTGADLFKAQSYNLTLMGDFENNYANTDGFNGGTGRVIFSGSVDQNIQGTQSTTFNILQINKTAGQVELNKTARVGGSIRFLSSSLLDLNSNNITLFNGARIYSDDGVTYDYTSFSAAKGLVNSGSGTDPLAGAFLEYELSTSTTLPYDAHFPITTPGVFTPMKIRLLNGGVSFSTNPKIRVKPVPQEHPDVETPNISLKKYWVVETDDITVNNNGAELIAYYDENEVEGNEGSYMPFIYSPNWNQANAYWRIKPGVNNYVDINSRYWYSQQVDLLEGDWTIGEQSAGQATYYARQDGDYNDPNTWSKIYFDGTASTTAPNKRSDRVRIQGHTVTISNATAPANLIAIEVGTEGRTNGILKIENNNYVSGDTFRIEAATRFDYGHQQGITLAPNAVGAVQTDVREYSSQATYAMFGNQDQVSGTGIPDLVKTLIIDKLTTATATLSKNIQVRDTLIINEGIFDLSSNSINGYTPNRTFVMNSGKFIVRSNFPINYTPPFLTSGTIEFNGTGNATIPSETSDPGIAQYHNLSIGGTRSGNITFENSGKIRIANEFDLDNLQFDNNTFRFLTSGSTVRLVKNGDQEIPYIPQTPTDSVVHLQYYNLELVNSGNKQIVGTSTIPLVVKNNLVIDSSAAFVQSNNDIEVQGSWANLDGTFTPTIGKKVTFYAPTNSVDLPITTKDTLSNYFEEVVIRGPGNVVPQDDFKIKGDLTFISNVVFNVDGVDLFLYGDWINSSGSFNHTNSTAYFQSNVLQSISKTLGDETFYNLTLRNVGNLNSNSIGTTTNNGLVITNNLDLTYGRIDARDRFVQVGGTISRSGGGYINSALRRVVGTDAYTRQFEVGYENVYTPITFSITGTGGTSGYVEILADTITTSSTPIYWNADPPTILNPTGSNINVDKHIARQWKVQIPSGSSFALGGTRKFDATLHFLGDSYSPNDLRNSSNTELLDVFTYTGSAWISPLQYGGTYPSIDTRYDDSIRIKDMIDIGTIVVGEPTVVTYYTRGNGNWNDAGNWSNISYDGTAATTYPGQASNYYRAFIGAGHEITLNINTTVNNSSSGSGIVAVDSSGVLVLSTNTISGDGEFRMYKNSTIEIGSPDGITATAATGNVQTTTRSYNYLSHDLGTFIYTGSGAQNTGDGLPTGADSVYVLIVNKTGTLTLNTSNNLSVLDSLYIQSGTFNSGSRDIYLYGNMRKASGTDFQANSRTFNIVGEMGDTLTTENYSQSIKFYNLQINKPEYSGNVVLDQNAYIEVEHQLTFNSANYAIIDGYTLSNETTPSYLKMGTSGSISGARQIISATQGGGWIYGRLHRYINAGDASNVVFEVGDDLYYAPLEVDFRSGSGSTAGYLSAIPFYGFHPKLYNDPQSLYPVNPNRVVLIYWSLRKPSGSTFWRGARNFNVTMRFPHPDYTTLLDCVGCADVTYYRGGDSLQWWQTMGRDHTSLDNSGTQYFCSDTRGTLTTPNFDYDGSSCTSPDSPTSWISVNNLNTSFGDDEIFANGDTLLADFVAGNRNSIRFYNFYSIKDGDWTDPTTWSTVSYNDTTNAARWDSDPNTYGFPTRQYDNVLIGNNINVKLNSDIGHNDYTDPPSTYTFAGPSVKVFETGTLDFGTRTLRGNGFRVFNGGRIKVGAINGITTGTSGNVQLGSGNTPTYSDSCSVVFTAEGSNISAISWGVINRNASTHYLEEVTIRRSSDNAIIMQSITGNQRTNSTDGHNYIWDKTADLVAGTSYYIQINPSNSRTDRRIRAWINYNYDGDFGDTGEMILDTTSTTDTTLRSYASFTVPSGTNVGTSHLRIGINSSTSTFTSTSTGYGEFEEYTINIVNPATNVVQNTNSGLPTKLSSFEVNSPRPTSIIRLSKNIEVVDSVKVSSGFFYPEASSGTDYTIKSMGAFIVDTLGGFIPQQGTVELYGETRDSIRSKVSGLVIPFYNLTINKAYSDTMVYVDDVDISISNNFAWNTDNKVSLTDNNIITLNQNSTLTGNFSEDRMFVVSGSTSSGIIEKQFTTTSGASNPKSFTFPIGIVDKYYPLVLYDTASSYSTTPIVKATIASGKHPDRYTDYCLDVYWRTNFNAAFTNLDTLKFSYYPANVSGDSAMYVPSMWDGDSWVIDLGKQPWAKSSPIILQETYYFKAANPSEFAEWTAGQPLTFATGRIFYSKNSGQWDDYLNWSTDPTLMHTGPAASYYPGELFKQDTVNLDGHTITFDNDSLRIDSLRIGGTNSIANQGQLVFGNTANAKKLSLRQLHLSPDTGDEGYVFPDANGTNQDTIEITQDIINEANSSVASGFRQSNNLHNLHIKFSGSGNSNLNGEGNWDYMQQVIVDKDSGLADTLIVNSQSYATASSTVSLNPYFVLNSGILQNNSGIPLMIGADGSNVVLKPGSGLHTKNGGILTFGSLTASANSTIYLENGDLEVGDEADENFYYYTNSLIDLIGSRFIVSGGFAKQNPVATTTLNMTGSSELIVGKIGYTAIEPTLDLSSTGTSINMAAGRIIVANANPNSSTDVSISASSGTGFTGTSTLQIGDSTLTTSTDDIRISGTTHINNLHLVDNGTTNLTTKLASLNYNVKGDITIDPLQNLDINGNTLNLQGDLYVWGNVIGAPTAPTSSSWRMQLNGAADQSIVNYNTTNDEIEIYSLRIDKTTGNVVLGDGISTANTYLKVNDHLEFTATNNALIDGFTNDELTIVGPNAASLGIYQITRTNLGHIVGTLQRYISTGNQIVNFPIGLDTITSYRPVELDVIGTANTAGFVNATVYKDPHPQIATSGIKVATAVPRYWRVVQSATTPFTLGVDGEYKITTTFINPNDVVDSASLSLFEHRLYDITSTWTTPDFLTNSSTSVTSQNVTNWGDYIIGEPNTVTFYSIADGNWQDVNTWSLTSYDIPNPPTRMPNQNTDIVRIGNGKKVTLLDDGSYPNVRNVIVETYNGNKGYLQIDGNLNYLSGLVFQLDDENTLGVQHIDGIRPPADGDVGPIHTTARNFGVSRYIFNNALGNQITGTALPNYVQSIIVDNTSTSSNKRVYLSNFPGAPIININDSLHIRQGTFNLGNRNIRILGKLVVDSVFNEGKLEPLSSKITLDSNTTKYIVMKNRSGLNFFDLDSDEGNTYISREGSNITANTHLNIGGTLNFTGNSVLILGDSTNINITNNSINAIKNYSASRYIRTSRESGSLIRALSSTGTYFYPIGSFETTDNYALFELTISAMTTAGKLGVRTSPGDRGGFPGGHSRISTAPNAEYLKRYWTLDSITAIFSGVAKFNYLDGDVFGTETDYNRLGRWRPVREVAGGTWMQYINPTIDFANNYFETTAGYSSSDMMGDWTIGNAYAFRRIFFSRQNGVWNDPNSWTYSDAHSGPIFGTGIWPDDTQDSVVIGGGNGTIPAHEITLNLDADVQGTALGTSAVNRGILNTNNFTLSGDYFTFADYSHLKITSAQGISSLGNSTGNILTTIKREFNTNGIYEFNGNTNQSFGDGLPNSVYSLIINNSGVANNNIVSFDKDISIANDFNINQGVANLVTYTANNSVSSGIFSISANARMIVGGANNILTSVNNYTNYNIDIDSYIQFDGNLDQIINNLPTNLTNGLGNVDLTNSGTKYVNNQLLIRGNLTNYNPAVLSIDAVNSLEVRKSVINESQIINQGILEIGQ